MSKEIFVEIVDEHIPPNSSRKLVDTPIGRCKIIALLSTQHVDQLILRFYTADGVEIWYPERAFIEKGINKNVKVFVNNERENIYGFTIELEDLQYADLINASDVKHIIYYLYIKNYTNCNSSDKT